MRRLGATIMGLLALASCGPLPVDQAERICIPDAQAAQHPRGSVGFGVESNGHSGVGFEIGISSDFLTGRDPDAVYAACVQQRSGQPPTRPFSSLPEAHL